jgi:hypothetical protein
MLHILLSQVADEASIHSTRKSVNVCGCSGMRKVMLHIDM